MPKRKVQAQAQTHDSCEKVWNHVRNFCAPWHPAIDTMSAQTDARRGLIRSFSAGGAAKVYKERLTFFSDSERTMTYTHLEGIEGADAYDGRLSVYEAQDGAAMVSMSAEISANQRRVDEIAAGTQAIFDMGVAALADVELPASMKDTRQDPDTLPTFDQITIDALPRLTLTVSSEPSPAQADVLCLFLHGIGGNRSNWDAQLHAVAPLCRVAALDLRGYGDSTLGSHQSSVDDYCADILRVMQVLGAKRLVLCGLSYGAWIATSFAMRHPELLLGLVLSGGCTGLSEAGQEEREAFRRSREVPMNNGQTPADFAPSVVNVITGPNASDTVRSTLTKSMQNIPSETYRDALRCFTNPLERFDFSNIIAPVLLMTGEHDRLAPPDEIKAVAERIFDAASDPDVRFEMIQGAGHVCNLERPEDYNRILLEFLERLLP